jgi:hypothetical protein
VVESLPNKHEALSLKPSITRKREEKEREREKRESTGVNYPEESSF